MPLASSASPSLEPAPQIEPHVRRIMIVVILGTIMSVLDTTVVNVALDTLSKDLHSPFDSVQWVVTGYLLSLAAVIPITGWAARRFGARRIYMTSLVVFTLGSAACGLAWDVPSLVFFRVVQGIGGGMLIPIGQMVLVRAAGPRNLPRVMATMGVPVILAPIFGPTVGGFLLEHAGWQWIFLINVPVGAIAVFAAYRLLPIVAPEPAGKLDFIGLVVVATGLVGITYGLAESNSAGSLFAAQVLVPALVGVALVALFVVRALRIDKPLLDVRLYKNRAFSAASITTMALGAALFGAMILMPLYFQLVRHEDAVHTGLLLIPQGLGAACAMRLSGRFTERFGGGATAFIGVSITVVATVPFVLLGADTPFVLIALAMIVRGFGIGMSMMPSMTAAFASLRPEQVPDASPQLVVLQRVGGSIGTAILSVILQANLDGAGANASPAALADAFGHTYLWVIAITAIAIIPTIVLSGVERRVRQAGRLAVVEETGVKADQAELAMEAA
jgi:EmrB/QacA subfamily drug resistance transporter